MRERFINILKYIFISFGVLFVLQILIATILAIQTVNIWKFENKTISLSDSKPIIDKLNLQFEENKKFPQSLENFKTKKHITFEYKPNQDLSCYTLIVKNSKKNTTQEINECKIYTNNGTSHSQSFKIYNN